MAFCTHCGTPIPDGVKFCTACGTPTGVTEAAPAATTAATPVTEQPPVAPPPAPQPVPAPQPYVAPQQPPYAPAPAQPVAAVYQEEPISTGGYIGIFLLLMLPVVNLVCLLIWACGGCHKRNKANLARALLVWTLIGAVLAGIILLIGNLLFGDTLDSLRELGSQIGNAAGGVTE